MSIVTDTLTARWINVRFIKSCSTGERNKRVSAVHVYAAVHAYGSVSYGPACGRTPKQTQYPSDSYALQDAQCFPKARRPAGIFCWLLLWARCMLHSTALRAYPCA